MSIMTLRADTTVLIVDDDAASRSVLRLACASVGIDVVEAATGFAALEEAGAASFAVILLDLGLPDITGLEVCRRLRAHDMVTPIIVVSAHSRPSQVELGLAAGADDYIGKPYRLAKLLARIQAYAQPGGIGVQLPGLPIQRRPGAATRDGVHHADRDRPRQPELRP
jgi:DNA-binding response OmpR family regulator